MIDDTLLNWLCAETAFDFDAERKLYVGALTRSIALTEDHTRALVKQGYLELTMPIPYRMLTARHTYELAVERLGDREDNDYFDDPATYLLGSRDWSNVHDRAPYAAAISITPEMSRHIFAAFQGPFRHTVRTLPGAALLTLGVVIPSALAPDLTYEDVPGSPDPLVTIRAEGHARRLLSHLRPYTMFVDFRWQRGIAHLRVYAANGLTHVASVPLSDLIARWNTQLPDGQTFQAVLEEPVPPAPGPDDLPAWSLAL